MSYMLQEQRKINDELMSQMREMQMTMQDMRSKVGGGDRERDMDRGFSSFGSGCGGDRERDIDRGFSSFGSGYGEGGYGGGKMFSPWMSGSSGSRSTPYNNRVAKHEGDWDW